MEYQERVDKIGELLNGLTQLEALEVLADVLGGTMEVNDTNEYIIYTDVYAHDCACEEVSLVEKIREYVEENDLEYRSNYSGRGMFGKTCVGLLCPSSMMTDIIAELGIPGARWDNMGCDMIVYWPNISESEGEDDE